MKVKRDYINKDDHYIIIPIIKIYILTVFFFFCIRLTRIQGYIDTLESDVIFDQQL